MISTLSNVVANVTKRGARSGCLTALTRIKRVYRLGGGSLSCVETHRFEGSMRIFHERGGGRNRLGSVDHIFVRIVASSSRGITRKIDRTYLPKPNYTCVHPLSLS